MMVKFPDRLREALNDRSWTQADLCRATGYGRSKVSQWLSGRNDPNGAALTTLASVLRVDGAWLSGYDVPKTIEKGPYLLAEDEKDIIDEYRMLNESGRAKLRERASELLRLPENTEKGVTFASSA